MSYTTRCPACGTTFRVVPDQLKISDGWVRCGHCADVFDATLYLEEWVPPPAPAIPEAPPSSEPSPSIGGGAGDPVADLAPEQDRHRVPYLEEPAPALPSEWTGSEAQADAAINGEVLSAPGAMPAWMAPDEVSHVAAGPDALPVVDVTASADVASETDKAAEPSAPASPMDAPTADADSAWWGASEAPSTESPLDAAPDAARETPLAVSEPLSEAVSDADERASDFHAELARFAEASGRITPDPVPAQPAAAPVPEPSDVPVVDAAEPEQEAAEPSFVRQARRQAFWRSPAVRAALVLVAVALGGLLAAQWAVHERDQLAASHPGLTPLLTQLCAPLGCEVGPARRIEAVVIDSSTLARRLGNFYAFDVVIKNTASIPVAVPALELSLTDTRDSVIARRVFLQSELPGSPSLLPAQGSLPLSLRLSITDAGAVSMAGYRVLIFYP